MCSTLRQVVFDTRDALADQLGSGRMEDLAALGASQPVEAIVYRTRQALLAPGESG
jgi:hypothetical protein